ncbi:hypothetical protein Bbelb_120890 [Branchiostoma belcheri]|nr:hypothetical protein Bbelb_120890 [Branchiostoma belcheri]
MHAPGTLVISVRFPQKMIQRCMVKVKTLCYSTGTGDDTNFQSPLTYSRSHMTDKAADRLKTASEEIKSGASSVCVSFGLPHIVITNGRNMNTLPLVHTVPVFVFDLSLKFSSDDGPTVLGGNEFQSTIVLGKYEFECSCSIEPRSSVRFDRIAFEEHRQNCRCTQNVYSTPPEFSTTSARRPLHKSGRCCLPPARPPGARFDRNAFDCSVRSNRVRVFSSIEPRSSVQFNRTAFENKPHQKLPLFDRTRVFVRWNDDVRNLFEITSGALSSLT